MHIFISGEIGVGKSTAIRRAVLASGIDYGGFRTVGAAAEGAASGVYIIPAAYAQIPPYPSAALVALRDPNRPPRVFPQGFEQEGLRLLQSEQTRRARLILMDELGFLESDSPLFRAEVLRLLDGPTPILGVVKPRPIPFLDAVRAHPASRLLMLSPDNREEITARLSEWLQGLAAGQPAKDDPAQPMPGATP